MSTRVKLEDVHEKVTPKEEIDRPIRDAFQRVRSYTRPLLNIELLRKRRRVKRIE